MKKRLIYFLSNLFPEHFPKRAYHVLTHPQIKKLRPQELEVLDTAEKEQFDFNGTKLATYHWPGKGEKVLFIHGWEGQAGNFYELIERLKNTDLNLFAFDAPAHGFSSSGKTTLWVFGDAVAAMIEYIKPDYLLSHSFGGVATTSALKNNPNFKISKYILLCPPDSFSERIDQIAEMVGISSKVKSVLKAQIQHEIELPITDLSVSNFVKTITIPEVLILHDEADKVVPIEQSLRVAQNWSVAQHITLKGTGHFRILRDDKVHARIEAFFNRD
ncbi:MAG: pimeloyl-ACP methyl ester carboxylesterase [Flavobacteriales bacterium]|jgi:pimeloyl-ACP methyl ester carboxylesterase